MSTLDDEFRFIPSDSKRVGRSGPLPRIERVWVGVTDGRRMSAIKYQPEITTELDAGPDEGFTAASASDSDAEYVFLHGAGLNAHGYDPVVLALDSAALSLDLPGHGQSDWREDATYHPDVLATDVSLAIAQLTSEPFTLVGHSLGGLTAICVAAANPEAIRRLVLIDVTPGIVTQRDASSVNEFITGKRDYASHEEIVDRAIAFGIGYDREALARGVALNTRQRNDGRWEWMHHLAHLENLAISDNPEDDEAQRGGDTRPAEPFAALWQPLAALEAAGVPVTLIAAREGMVGEQLIAGWEKRLPQSSVVTLAGPHNLHEAVPVELASLLRRLDM